MIYRDLRERVGLESRDGVRVTVLVKEAAKTFFFFLFYSPPPPPPRTPKMCRAFRAEKGRFNLFLSLGCEMHRGGRSCRIQLFDLS